jgi:hypothetical protein
MTMDGANSRRDLRRRVNWSIVGPVGILAVVLLAVVWFDVTTGGDAEPPALLGSVGTPVRGTFVPSTAVPRPTSTPRPPRPTPESAAGTPADRDAQRRADLLVLLAALEQFKAQEGEYLSTGGNIQTLCVYRENDLGCRLEDVLGHEVPRDPLGDAIQDGYWYSSDGDSATIYASLEGDVPESERCRENPDFAEATPNLICVTAR